MLNKLNIPLTGRSELVGWITLVPAAAVLATSLAIGFS